MDTFSSCYFCGAALEDPLGSYRLGETTVVLCHPCHSRLETLLDAADATVETEALEDSAAVESGSTSGESSSRDRSADEEPRPSIDRATPDPDTADAESAAPTGDDPAAAPDDETGNAAADDTDPGENAADPGSTAETAPASGSEASADDASADTDGDATDVELSAREYRKVLRLLRNREFPIDREEIETVAANAYGLSRAECVAVIDAAIERGRLKETADGLRPGPER